jgi:hypothetical protein
MLGVARLWVLAVLAAVVMVETYLELAVLGLLIKDTRVGMASA